MLILIPHAGETFAGAARKQAFDRVHKQAVRRICYVSAAHRVEEPRLVPLHQSLEAPFVVDSSRACFDHSFLWVLPELLREFPNLERIDVWTPCSDTDVPVVTQALLLLPPQEAKGGRENEAKGERERETLIVATADLTHFGDEYGFYGSAEYHHHQEGNEEGEAMFPQLGKIQTEAELLDAVLRKDAGRLAALLERNPNLTCSPWVLKVVVAFSSSSSSPFYPSSSSSPPSSPSSPPSSFSFSSPCNGTVVDYYDSAQLQAGVAAGCWIDRYCPVTVTRAWSSFVSYASLVFSSKIPENQFCTPELRLRLLFGHARLALRLALGSPQPRALRLLRKLRSSSLTFPSWARDAALDRRGVFVGTTSVPTNGSGPPHTSCSMGRLELRRKAKGGEEKEEKEEGGGEIEEREGKEEGGGERGMELKVVAATLDCIDDAQARWGTQLDDLEGILSVKIEFLSPRESWRPVDPDREEIERGVEGIQATFLPPALPAIYLPSVWAEEKEWSFQRLVDELCLKAGQPRSNLVKLEAFRSRPHYASCSDPDPTTTKPSF